MSNRLQEYEFQIMRTMSENEFVLVSSDSPFHVSCTPLGSWTMTSSVMLLITWDSSDTPLLPIYYSHSTAANQAARADDPIFENGKQARLAHIRADIRGFEQHNG